MKFIVDGMLGSLARWLRILGCDVKYYNGFSDYELLKIAEKEDRALLTRDLDLFRRANVSGLKTLLVEGKDQAERLAHTAQHFNVPFDIDMTASRCPLCGSSLHSCGKDVVSDRVPAGTLKHYDKFWICSDGCGKVFWRGRHWVKITETLNKAKKLKKEA